MPRKDRKDQNLGLVCRVCGTADPQDFIRDAVIRGRPTKCIACKESYEVTRRRSLDGRLKCAWGDMNKKSKRDGKGILPYDSKEFAAFWINDESYLKRKS